MEPVAVSGEAATEVDALEEVVAGGGPGRDDGLVVGTRVKGGDGQHGLATAGHRGATLDVDDRRIHRVEPRDEDVVVGRVECLLVGSRHAVEGILSLVHAAGEAEQRAATALLRGGLDERLVGLRDLIEDGAVLLLRNDAAEAEDVVVVPLVVSPDFLRPEDFSLLLLLMMLKSGKVK